MDLNVKNGMDIIVCMKQVPDPDAPPAAFDINPEEKKVIPKGVAPVISPYDENALEAALRIKDESGAKIVILSMGKKLSQRVFVNALAAGADDLILFQDDSCDGLDHYATAHGIAAAIRKIGAFDLILLGMQASDSNGGQTGLGVAEILGVPGISMVHAVELVDERLRVERENASGYTVLETHMPALLTISSELYQLRYPTLPDLRAAQKKPFSTWNASDVGVDLSKMHSTELVELSPRISNTQCEIIEGESTDGVGVGLALKLRELNLI
jgi:electron transfer flavoprotein beta subunit